MNRIAAASILIAVLIAAVLVFVYLGNHDGGDDSVPETDPEAPSTNLIMTVDGKRISADWESNPSVDAIKALANEALTINMERYGGFEQTGKMKSIARNDSFMDVGCGDIVLYNGNQICLYFGENSYSFTRLGKITGMTDSEIIDMLDRPSVTAVFTLERELPSIPQKTSI